MLVVFPFSSLGCTCDKSVADMGRARRVVFDNLNSKEIIELCSDETRDAAEQRRGLDPNNVM